MGGGDCECGLPTPTKAARRGNARSAPSLLHPAAVHLLRVWRAGGPGTPGRSSLMTQLNIESRTVLGGDVPYSKRAERSRDPSRSGAQGGTPWGGQTKRGEGQKEEEFSRS